MSTSNSFTAVTKPSIECGTFVWQLEQLVDLQLSERLRSPSFTIADHKWCLEIQKISDVQSQNEFLKIHVFHGCRFGCCSVKARFQIICQNGENILKSRKSKIHEFARCWSWGFSKFYPFDELAANCETLTIKCQIDVVLGSETSSNIEPKKLLMPPCTLVSDFSQLLALGLHSDVVFIVQGESIRAHRAILTARSAVFRTMFDTALPMRESKEGVVEVNDADPLVFKELLRYIYTGVLADADLKHRTPELLRLADMYDVPGLKAVCCTVLGQRMTPETAASTLAIADMYHTSELRSRAMSYILDQFAEVIVTDDFRELVNSNPRLVSEIHQCYARSIRLKRALPDPDENTGPSKRVRSF